MNVVIFEWKFLRKIIVNLQNSFHELIKDIGQLINTKNVTVYGVSRATEDYFSDTVENVHTNKVWALLMLSLCIIICNESTSSIHNSLPALRSKLKLRAQAAKI